MAGIWVDALVEQVSRVRFAAGGEDAGLPLSL